MLRSRLSFSSLVIGIACVAGISRAALAADDPAPALIANINGVVDLALGKSPDAITARLSEIRSKMSEMFAVDAIVQRAFGGNWKKLSAAEQKDAVDLLGRLIIRTYAMTLSTGSRPTLAVKTSRKIADDRWEVVSTAAQDGKVVNVVYRLAPIDGPWKVYDVLAENVSVVGNYRQQFDAHFQKKSAADLIQLLRDKLAAPATAEKATS